MFTLVVNDINEFLHYGCKHILRNGEIVTVRGKETRELHPYFIQINDPTRRTLLYPHRGSNPFAVLFETLWVLGNKSNDISLLKKFLPRAVDYSDDGKTWRAGYPERIRNYGNVGGIGCNLGVDQLLYVYDKLKADPETRQAVISLWNPEEDCYLNGLRGFTDDNRGLLKSKDFPCSNHLVFLIRNGKLDLTFTIRSNDMIFGACLPYSQKIKLLDGTCKPIGDLVGKNFWVYSKDSRGNIVPGYVKKCWKTGKKDILKITFNDGTSVETSVDHKFLLKNNQYVKASELKIGSSIDSVYTKVGKRGYEQAMNNGEWEYTHQLVAREMQISLPAQYSYGAIHHKDFNKNNNSPDNLEWMSRRDHMVYHGKLANSERMKVHQMKGNRKRWAKPDNHIKQSEMLKESWKDPDYREMMKLANKKSIDKCRKLWNKNGKWADKCRKRISNTVITAHNKGKYRTEKFLSARKLNMTKYNQSDIGRKKSSESGKANWKKSFGDFLKSGKNTEVLRKIHKLGLCNTPEARTKYAKTRIIKTCRMLIDKGLKINEANYFKIKGMGVPGWDKAINKYFNGYQNLIDCTKTYNHRVVKIEKLGYMECCDLEVDKHHNFALDNGVITHNSSINFYEFSVIQEILARKLNVGVGKFYYIANSLHIYAEHYDKAKELVYGKGADYYDFLDNESCDPQTVTKYDLPIFKFGDDNYGFEECLGGIEDLIRNLESDAGLSRLAYNANYMQFKWLNDAYNLCRIYLKYVDADWKNVSVIESYYREMKTISLSDLKVACHFWMLKHTKAITADDIHTPINECLDMNNN